MYKRSTTLATEAVKLKKLSVEYKGGKCCICSYDRCINALEFHHLNPELKSFGIASANKSWDKIKSELDKTIMVCSNCHRELEYNLCTLRPMAGRTPD